MSRSVRQRVEALAKVGLTARAVIVAAAGTLVVQAALAFDPNKAKGLDGTLEAFAHTPIGPWLLVLMAGGVLAFGLIHSPRPNTPSSDHLAAILSCPVPST